MFSVDGIEWPWPCDIARAAEVRPSSISGMMLDRNWFNDVLGTYMAYTVNVAVPVDRRDEYARLYEALTEPVDGHRFVLPYNGGQISVTGRVQQVTDVLVRMPGGGCHWKGVRFTVIANHPSRAISAGEAIRRGRAPVPEVAAPSQGDCYTWRDGAWVETRYADADEVAY